MKLNDTYLEKTDPLLRSALEHASDGDMLRAVLLLNQVEDPDSAEELRPDQFPSRQAWREALIARRADQLTGDLTGTLQALEGLSLQPRGGTLGRTVVVEGPARQILTSLSLPGVRHASLDQPIHLVGGTA